MNDQPQAHLEASRGAYSSFTGGNLHATAVGLSVNRSEAICVNYWITLNLCVTYRTFACYCLLMVDRVRWLTIRLVCLIGWLHAPLVVSCILRPTGSAGLKKKRQEQAKSFSHGRFPALLFLRQFSTLHFPLRPRSAPPKKPACALAVNESTRRNQRHGNRYPRYGFIVQLLVEREREREREREMGPSLAASVLRRR